jgi:hypothetical protein
MANKRGQDTLLASGTTPILGLLETAPEPATSILTALAIAASGKAANGVG